MILAVDPGKKKCGIALMDRQAVFSKTVVPQDELFLKVQEILKNNPVSKIVLGGSTSSRDAKEELIKTGLPVEMVAEAFSTVEAKKRYFKENPPRGFWKLVPLTLRTPPVPIDDYAAVILGERYFKNEDFSPVRAASG